MLREESPGRLNPLTPESSKEWGESLLTHDGLEGGRALGVMQDELDIDNSSIS
jgi:hypothetical protein